MLISHSKKFIFTKTVKTAGTSVEVYFEPYCIAPGQWQASNRREEHHDQHGIVGARTGSPLGIQGSIFWNHMPAKTIRALVGAEVWDTYCKFCTVRNPFDQLVSMYLWFGGLHGRPSRKRTLLSRIRLPWVSARQWNRIRQKFQAWLEKMPLPIDRNKYIIDGEFCMDHVLRFESLLEDVEGLCGRLGIPFDRDAFPHYKKIAPRDRPTASFYTASAMERVREAYADELERFGYSPPDR